MADDSALTITETLEIPLAELHFQVKNHGDNLDMSGSSLLRPSDTLPFR
jgi:hypothetical protein